MHIEHGFADTPSTIGRVFWPSVFLFLVVAAPCLLCRAREARQGGVPDLGPGAERPHDAKHEQPEQQVDDARGVEEHVGADARVGPPTRRHLGRREPDLCGVQVLPLYLHRLGPDAGGDDRHDHKSS